MIELVISGGQTGADQGGWIAAREAGIATGGWMPHGYLTEDGPRPDLAELYGAKEHPIRGYPPRTHANARAADATAWFGRDDTRGYRCTADAVGSAGGKLFVIRSRKDRTPDDLALLIVFHGIVTLNVAGNRESISPGIRDRVAAYLGEVFRLLADDAARGEELMPENP